MATQYTAGLAQGQVLTADIMNQIGAAWETWTPTVTQTGNVTVTINYAKYTRIQKLVVAQFYLTVTGTGTAGSAVSVSLPITNYAASSQMVGGGFIFDASATNLYTVQSQIASTTTVQFYSDQTGTASFWGIAPNVGLAVNDQIRCTVSYEAA